MGSHPHFGYPMLDLRRLRYFVEIVDHGSISAASRALNVAQPALSHHISELERTSGAPLLERLPRGVRPTSVGKLLLRHARPILKHVEEAEIEIKRAVGSCSEPRIVHLAMIPSLATTLTPDLLAAASTHFPTLTLHIVEGKTSSNHQMIINGEIDLAVNLANDSNHGGEFLLEEPLFFIIAAGPDARDVPIDFSDLASERLIMPSPPNPLRVLLDKAAKQLGVTLGDFIEIDGLNSLKRAVAAGMGGTVISWPAVSHECAAGELVARRIVNPPFCRRVILERSQRIDTDTVRKVRTLLARVLEQAHVSAPGRSPPIQPGS
jgi:LysR family nitrogen assimilation transcriptional regulator